MPDIANMMKMFGSLGDEDGKGSEVDDAKI